jgi:hypothetical protein
MLTFGDVKSSRVVRVAGVCPESPDFAQITNDVIRELLDRGNWWNTLKIARGCIYNNCITWNRYVGTVEGFNRCGSAPIKNGWMEFNAVLPEHVNHFNRTGSFLCANDLALVDQGTSPVFNQIPCNQNRFIQFYITQAADVGKTITLFGVDGNGLDIITQRSDGTIQPGVVLSLALPFVQAPMLFRQITRVIKDVTVGPVYGYQFDGTNTFPLAVYAPDETNPDYRTQRLTQGGCVATNCQQFPSKIEAYVKLAFVPVVNDNDLVLIDSLDALALGYQAMKLGDAYDFDGQEKGLRAAVLRLNMQLRNKLPVDATPVRFKPYGTATLERRSIGRLM